MLTNKFVPDDVASECSQCIHELCFVHGLRLYENRGLLIVLFTGNIRLCATTLDVRCQPWESIANLCGADEHTSQRRIIAAAIGLQDSCAESATNSIAFRVWLLLSRERVDHSVDSSPCALHDTVRDVSGCDGRVLRHVPRRAHWACFNAANANSKGQND